MDLFKIIKSKTRENILKLYFSDPQKKYYLRQLEKILEIPVGNIRRELLSLHNFGLFKKEPAGNQVYYYLNQEAALYNDLKNIVFKTIGIEGELKKALKKIPCIEEAFVFGSFAKDKSNSSSDVDLMIIGRPNDDLLVKKISRLESTFNREINYHLIDREEWNKKLKTDSFIKAINKGPIIKIIWRELLIIE